jgi:hypothetical protein
MNDLLLFAKGTCPTARTQMLPFYGIIAFS